MKGTLRLVPVALPLAVLLFAPRGALAGTAKCLSREGQCIAVTVNGQPNVKLGKKTKKLLRDLERASHHVRDARYEIAAPVRGELDVRAVRGEATTDWFGEVREVDAKVVPLGNVELQTHDEVATADNVRVGGSAAVGVQRVLDQKRLPPGKYLLVVSLYGVSNWDRQVLFFEVAE